MNQNSKKELLNFLKNNHIKNLAIDHPLPIINYIRDLKNFNSYIFQSKEINDSSLVYSYEFIIVRKCFGEAMMKRDSNCYFHKINNFGLLYTDLRIFGIFQVPKLNQYDDTSLKQPTICFKIQKKPNSIDIIFDYCTNIDKTISEEDANDLLYIIKNIKNRNFKELGFLEYYMYIDGEVKI